MGNDTNWYTGDYPGRTWNHWTWENNAYQIPNGDILRSTYNYDPKMNTFTLTTPDIYKSYR